MLKVGSLFSGIGGFDLGLERTGGFRTEWFCEQDEFCQRVLAKHWPGRPCFGDVAALRSEEVQPIDLLCGGFPCQDISYAGKGAGLAGARSGLWSEFARLIGELEPRYVVVENVPALRRRGLSQVLADLDSCGYDAEWDGIPASAVGAPHKRDRIWIVAYPRVDIRLADTNGERGPARREARYLAGTQGTAQEDGEQRQRGRDAADDCRPDVAHAPLVPPGDANPSPHSLTASRQARKAPLGRSERDGSSSGSGPWGVEPDVGRVAHGVPDRVDRLRSLGNALVPQIAEWIGYRILEAEGLK